MNNKRPILSVVIATKNRERYCVETINSILNLESEEIEITIADNSATTAVKKYVEKLGDSRIKYRYDNSAISSIQNFNRAMELATGDYVCLLGDDDGMLPNALETLKWASENDVDSFCSNRAVAFYWPGALERYPNGFVEIPVFSDARTKIFPKKELDSLLKSGLQNYLLYSLPKSYHGFVKRSLMQKIKDTTGHFYGGLSPDIYSAVALSLLAENHYVVDMPLTIAGVCKTSTTADNFSGKHSGSIEDIPHLKNRGPYQWSNLVPRYYSTNTIWAESGIKALEEMKHANKLSFFNIYYMVAQGVINNYKFIPEILKLETLTFRKNRKIGEFKFFVKLLLSLNSIVYKKVVSLIDGRKRRTSFSKSSVTDIHECVEICVKVIKC